MRSIARMARIVLFFFTVDVERERVRRLALSVLSGTEHPVRAVRSFEV